MNSGECQNPSNPTAQFACICPVGFAGRLCEEIESPCKNGGETDGTGCICPIGFEGVNCEIETLIVIVEEDDNSLLLGIGVGIGFVILVALMSGLCFCVYQMKKSPVKSSLNSTADSRLEEVLEDSSTKCPSPVRELKSQNSHRYSSSTMDTSTIIEEIRPLKNAFAQATQSTDPPSYTEATELSKNNQHH